MNDALATKSKRASSRKGAIGRLFVLELSGGRIHSMAPDVSERSVIVTECHLPDGIAVDAAAGHIYWTNMGVPSLNDGSIERADIDGANRTVLRGLAPSSPGLDGSGLGRREPRKTGWSRRAPRAPVNRGAAACIPLGDYIQMDYEPNTLL